MGEQRPRRIAALAVLVLSTVALLATSYSPTLYGEAAGEMTIAQNDPAAVVVRFRVPAERADEIARISVRTSTGASSDSRIAVDTRAAISGSDVAAPGLSADLDPAACRRGCTVEVSLAARMATPGEGPLSSAWETEIQVDYESGEPNEPVVTTVADDGDAGPPRATWVAVGIALSAGAGVGFLALGRRLAVPRLVLSAALLAAAAWPWITTAPYLVPGGAIRLHVDWLTIVILGGAAVVLVGVAVGLWRASQGSPTILRVIGTLAAVAIGFSWWLAVEALPAYRPHEVALYSFGIMLPAAAAVTAPAVAEPAGRSRRTIGVATSAVIASQAVMALAAFAAAGVAIFMVVAGVIGLLTDPGRQVRLDLAMVVAVVIPIAVAAQFAVGGRAWRQGRWRPLFAADAPVALVVVAATVFVLAQPDRGFLSFDMPFRVFAVIATIVALVGTIGVGLVAPPVADSPMPPAPPPDGDRQQQSGEGDQVGRVAGEEHGTQFGERP